MDQDEIFRIVHRLGEVIQDSYLDKGSSLLENMVNEDLDEDYRDLLRKYVTDVNGLCDSYYHDYSSVKWPVKLAGLAVATSVAAGMGYFFSLLGNKDCTTFAVIVGGVSELFYSPFSKTFMDYLYSKKHQAFEKEYHQIQNNVIHDLLKVRKS